MKKTSLSAQQLQRVGDELASLWGGQCQSFETMIVDNVITYRFICVECGDYFYSDLSHQEVLSKYAHCL